MKGLLRYTALAVAIMPAWLGAQSAGQKAIATPQQIQARESYKSRFQQDVQSYNDAHPISAKSIAPSNQAPTLGKVSAVNPVPLGTASNALTCLRGEQNQVAVDNQTDAVAFIHRQDVTVWGGGGTENGKYRYDISIDNGASFSNDIGALQSTYTNYGRYPNLTFFNETGSSNPLSEKIVYQGPTNRFPTPGWIGQVNGLSDVATSGTPISTEHYDFVGQNSLLPGGLCEGLPGEFWAVEFSYDGNALMDSIRLLKGTYASGDITWGVHALLEPGYDKSFDGSIAAVGPNIAFSPDGMTGYVGIIANIVGGTNTNNETLLPVFFKTTDGGATWGNAIEVDLDAIPWIADSLQSLWVDSLGAPVSDGRATAAFDYDMVVDQLGNVHMGVVIGTAGGGFAISSSIAKFLGDITTPDGGATWDVTYMSPILAFRGTYGGGSAPIDIDNFVQMSRDDAGQYVFFSWVDSDTSQYTGTMNGTGFGESANNAPNLRIAAKNVIGNGQTYPQLVSDGDLLWEGRILNPMMAPTVVVDGNVAHLPIVVLELLQNDPNLESKFWYFGGDATIDLSNSSMWCDPAGMDLGWLSISTPGATPPCITATEPTVGNQDVVLYDWYPNPSNGTAKIGFELPAAINVKMDLMNIQGQHVVTLVDGELNAGRHVVQAETNNLAAGLYFCQLTAGGKTYSKRLVVSK